MSVRGDTPGAVQPSEPSPLELILARGRWRAAVMMLGPAFVASVAYVDPGNFATNFTAGSQFGYRLIWVVAAANLMAMLVQYLAAKIGIATDQTLPELCRDRFSRPLAWVLWAEGEVMAMATDVAEFVGAALGLNLLFDVPLRAAVVVTAVISFGLLHLGRAGYRRFELAISALLAVVFVGFVYELFKVAPSAHAALGGLLPRFTGRKSVLLAVGIVGATVMPHVIYLHSELTRNRTVCRDDTERARVLRFERLDVVVALGLAGLVNLAMLAIAAALFFHDHSMLVTTLDQVHAGLARMVGGGAALVFSAALFASGASSSSVGTYAGQVVMQGFIGLQIPLVVRRAVTMAPAVILLWSGFDPTTALIDSQVVLSFGIPFALVPLVLVTADRETMGVFVNRATTTVVASVLAVVISALNFVLILEQFTR